MHHAFEHCELHRQAPQPSDSLASVCWPLVCKQQPVTVIDDPRLCGCPPKPEIRWPMHEPWRQNVHQSRCEGQGRCQGDPERCSSKYRYGAEVVCPVASDHSVKNNDGCCLHCTKETPKATCPAAGWPNNYLLR